MKQCIYADVAALRNKQYASALTLARTGMYGGSVNNPKDIADLYTRDYEMQEKKMNCSDTYKLFFKPGEVTEIRAVGITGKSQWWSGWARGIVAGYFDNAGDFGKAAQALDDAGARGVYFTVNPVIPDLLARAWNRLKVAGGKDTPLTTDKDIQCIRWLPVDLDPVRPAGISSSKEELTDAMARGRTVMEWMLGEKFGMPIVACSGNGCHLVFRLADLPNDEKSHDQVKKALATLNAKFSDGRVHIDVTVGNPARIWKVYGTHARKGDSMPNRPHRLARIIDVSK